MAFLRTAQPDSFVAPIIGDDIILRAPSAADYADWAELRALSRAHLTPWEPQWSRDDLSRIMFRRRLRAYARDMRDDIAYAFFITDANTGTLFGGLTLSNIRRGAAQTAALGYWMGSPHVGKGRMKTAVAMIKTFAFAELRLHRLEAATLPENLPSIRVLEANGFRQEGRVRGYLKINGTWRDHLLYGHLSDGYAAVTAKPQSAGRR